MPAPDRRAFLTFGTASVLLASCSRSAVKPTVKPGSGLNPYGYFLTSDLPGV